MQFIPIKTREMSPPKDDIFEILDEFLPPLKDRDIVLITSKIVSIHQGRCFKKDSVRKEDLIMQEADGYIRDPQKPGRILTMINSAFAINSGIDPFHEYYILLPKNSNIIAKEVHQFLCKKNRLSKLGVLITDSHSLPLRRGVMCYAVGYYGISPLIEHGNRKTYAKWTSNAVDAIAAFGGLYMGESAQRPQWTPIVIGRGIDKVVFSENTHESDFFVGGENDMYRSLYKNFRKKK